MISRILVKFDFSSLHLSTRPMNTAQVLALKSAADLLRAARVAARLWAADRRLPLEERPSRKERDEALKRGPKALGYVCSNSNLERIVFKFEVVSNFFQLVSNFFSKE